MQHQVFFVTGMHRSGTSHLAGRLRSAGLAFPGDLLAGNDDNPDGYFEARGVVQFNNGVFAQLGLDWKSLAAMHAEICGSDHSEFDEAAARCLQTLYIEAGCKDFAVKDPRLCRLLPIWRRAATSCGLGSRLIASLRPAGEIAASLFHRLRAPRFAPAAIDIPANAELLCLRYLLDLEAFSRAMPRSFVPYPEIADLGLEALIGENRVWPEIRALDRTDARYWADIASSATDRLASQSSGSDASWFDRARATFDASIAALGACTAAPEAPSQRAACLTLQAGAADRDLPAKLRVGFVSGAPDSRGHIYRIENRISSLRLADAGVLRVNPEECDPGEVARSVDIVVLFRTEMSTWLERLLDACKAAGTVTVFDIDDLVVDPGLMEPEAFRFLAGKPEWVQAEWKQKATAWRAAAERADICWATTRPLAEALLKINRQVRVLPNGLSDHSERVARKVRKIRSERRRDRVVLSYASGTPTHDVDFAQLAEPLCEVLARFPGARLDILGHLSSDALKPLTAVLSQVDVSPTVPYFELAERLARADINLAPLEAGNVFCECKSELKVFESGVLGVPTLASPTRPYREAIDHGQTGWIAGKASEWIDGLTQFVSDAGLREASGERAKEKCLQMFGPAAQRKAVLERLTEAASFRSRSRP